jgi:hypothetical protein
MTLNYYVKNTQGLFVDGFHITTVTCSTGIGMDRFDAGDEIIYAYTQDVLLSGLRGLWDAIR